MENTEYIVSSLDEYFEILDRENKKRSELVAKSLVKYLQKSKETNKFEKIQAVKKGQGKYLVYRGKNCKGLLIAVLFVYFSNKNEPVSKLVFNSICYIKIIR